MDHPGMLSANNSSDSIIVPKWFMVSLPACIVINGIHMVLLVRVMAREGPILRKPINWMILVDEFIRFLGSVGALHATFILGMWLDRDESNTTDCKESCCIYVFFTVLGSTWSIINGAGCFELNLFRFH